MKKISISVTLLSAFAMLTGCGSNSDTPNTASPAGKAFFRSAQNCSDMQDYFKKYMVHYRSQDVSRSPTLPSSSPGNASPTSSEASNPSAAPSPTAGVIQSDSSYADNERKLLYSFDKQNRLRIYKAAPLSEAGLLSQLSLDFSPKEILTLDGGNKKYVLVFGNIAAPIVDAVPTSGVSPSMVTSDYPDQKTVLTVIDVTTPQTPTITQQHIQDGSFMEARALPESGQIVWSSNAYVDPSNFQVKAASFTGQDCSNILLYENEEVNRYYPASLSAYTITKLDLNSANPEVSSKSLISGGWNNLFSVNLQHVFLAQSVTFSDNPTSELFMFNLPKTGKALELEASGSLAGYIGNQFFLDEKDSFIRVFHYVPLPNAMMMQEIRKQLSPQSPAASGNYLSVLEKSGGNLVSKSSFGPFEENESPFAARFMGKLACIITFENIDPLTCFDLSNPANPQKLGALEIAGVSFHLENINSEFLLGIGMSGDGSLVANLFDIRDPSHPRLSSQKPLNLPGTHPYSSVFYDYRSLSKDPNEYSYALPFSEYRTEDQRQFSAVALFKVDKNLGEIIVREGIRRDITLPSNASAWEDYNLIARAHFFGDALACVSNKDLQLYDRWDLSLHLSSSLE